MQKLIWRNANGEELNLTSGNYGITNWEGFANTSLNIQSQQVPFQDGGVFLDALIEQRELSVTLAMQDNGNLEERYEMRRELIHILNPKLGEGYLIYSNDFTSKRIKCIPQIPLFENHNSNDSGTPKASLAWTACEPYWEDLDETNVMLNAGVRSPIENTGDIPCNTVIDIYTAGVKNPSIKNLTSNKKIKLQGDFTENIRINTNVGNKEINDFNFGFEYGASGEDFSKVLFNSDTHVYLIGSYYGMLYSIDGENFITLNVPIKQVKDIIYNAEKKLFIAVGYNNSLCAIVTSEDGKNWIDRFPGISASFVLKKNNLFCRKRIIFSCGWRLCS